MKKNRINKYKLGLNNNKGFSAVLLIVVAQIVIFTMFFAYSPLQNQLLRLAKSNREFDVAHTIGVELGAKIAEAYNDASNTLAQPGDIVGFCEGIVGVLPRRGVVLRLTNPGGDFVFLCIPEDGIRIKHPMSPERFAIFGTREAANKFSFNNWLRFVEDLSMFAVHKKQPNENFFKLNFLASIMSGSQAMADNAQLIPGIKNLTNTITATTSARILFEPVSPLPFNAQITAAVSPPGGPTFPGMISVENINCRVSHHCIAYKFCTRINQENVPCTEEEFFWQVVAMPRLPMETARAPGL